MSNIAIFSNANLPVTAVAESLKKLEQATPSTMVILKMDKTGHWVFGADQTEVEKGTRWAVNPFSFVHGFIAWGKGEVLGEHMAPLTEPLPEVGVPPAGAERGWEQQFGFCLKALDGDDAGMEARRRQTGGADAWHGDCGAGDEGPVAAGGCSGTEERPLPAQVVRPGLHARVRDRRLAHDGR
jgi:hypothetical protein